MTVSRRARMPLAILSNFKTVERIKIDYSTVLKQQFQYARLI